MSNKTIVNLISPKLDRMIKVKYFLVDYYLSRDISDIQKILFLGFFEILYL